MITRKTLLAVAKRFSLIAMLLILPLSRAGANDPLGPRLKISLFRYAGSEGSEPKAHFSRFKGILRDKITVLVEELTGVWPGFNYLGNLALEPGGNDGFEDNLNTAIAVKNYWAASRSLILLRGSIITDADNSYSAQTRLFFGDLQGALPHPSLSVKLPINEEQFANTSDSHSLAIFYALAMDAARRGEKPAHVITLLSRAQDKIRDLSKRQSSSQSLIDIEKAVENAIMAQRLRSYSR